MPSMIGRPQRSNALGLEIRDRVVRTPGLKIAYHHLFFTHQWMRLASGEHMADRLLEHRRLAISKVVNRRPHRDDRCFQFLSRAGSEHNYPAKSGQFPEQRNDGLDCRRELIDFSVED